MKDFISLGTAPTNENCCQLCRPNYEKYGELEALEFRRMLLDYIDNLEDGIWIKITRNPHDFGNYYDVILEFDSNEETVNHACAIEDSIPNNWIENYGPGYGFLSWSNSVHADEYLSCTRF